MNILHLDSSMMSDSSVSSQISAAIVEHLMASLPHEQHQVVYRDLYANPPSLLTYEAMTAVRSGQEDVLDTGTHQVVAEIQQAIDELFACDVLVIGAPMYNHTIPTVLHAWIDLICQAGKTFRYTPQGPEGLIPAKPLYIASSRGGVYSTPETLPFDQQEVYLCSIFALAGLTDVTIFRAEGVGLPERRNSAMQAVLLQIQDHFA